MTVAERSKRNINIEILRIFSMFLIVLCHYFSVNYQFSNLEGLPHIMEFWVDKLTGQTGVCCFLLITGYFMVDKSFRMTRVIKTDIQVVIYSLILCICYYVLLATRAFPASIISPGKGSLRLPLFFSRYFLYGTLRTGSLLRMYFY